MLYMNARAEEPICHSLCPTSLGRACTRQRGINHRAHHAQMRTWAVYKCRVADWLAGWLAATGTHSLEMCAECMSHTVAQPAEDSPRYKQSSNASRLATAPQLAAVASRM